MAADSFSEVTSRSWFSRIGGAFKGIIAGLVLVAVAVGLLFWNEGRAVKRYKTLKEGGGLVITVSAEKVVADNDGKLVHTIGKADTEEVLRDPVFGVEAVGLRLLRRVEMYQWRESKSSETRKKLGGGEETVTTYDYDRTWADHLIDSASFKRPEGHQNPGRMAYQSQTVTAEHVTLGDFTLPSFLVAKIDNTTPLSLTGQEQGTAATGGTNHRLDNGFYLGEDPATPQIGDLRIQYAVVLPTEVSLVARQSGGSFTPYQTEAGGTIALLQPGAHAADAMFARAQRSNTMLTWALRFGGLLVMTLGFSMVLAPLVVFADVVPAIGSIIGAGTKFISFLLAGVISFITVAVAWLYYRPLLGVLFLALAAALGFYLVWRVKKADPVKPPPLPNAPPPPVPPQ